MPGSWVRVPPLLFVSLCCNDGARTRPSARVPPLLCPGDARAAVFGSRPAPSSRRPFEPKLVCQHRQLTIASKRGAAGIESHPCYSFRFAATMERGLGLRLESHPCYARVMPGPLFSGLGLRLESHPCYSFRFAATMERGLGLRLESQA